MGRRRAVEVPRRRLGRPLGRARGGRDRDAGVREPDVRTERARTAARRPERERGRGAPDGGRRGPRRAPARSRRRSGKRGQLDGPGLQRLGRAPHRARLRGAGQHPRRRGDGRELWRRPSKRIRSCPSCRGCSSASPRPRRPAATGAGSSRPRSSSCSETAATRDCPTSSSTSGSTTTSGPIQELRRIYGLHQRLFEPSPREEWLPVEGELRTEVGERLARLGYDSLDAWAGVENLEERVDGEDAIDPVALDALREASS